jgi:3-oxoacyl-[acyl-carrier protein] reductase
MAKKLEGKVAVVTGASKGIGAAIARHLADEGASVVVNYSSSKDGADKVVEQIKAKGGKAVAVGANLSKEADVRKLFAETKKAFGRVDVLINNAGIFEFKPLNDITADHFHKHFDLNVLGLIFASQEAARHFGPEGGNIVNISSAISSLTPPNSVVYSATKAAVDAVSRVLAKELASKKVRVNAVNPGMIVTEGVLAMDGHQDMRKWAESITPLGRVGEVDEIARAVTFLATADSSYVTGETLYVAGGIR